MTKLAYFNKLPPKPYYLERVLSALDSERLSLHQITARTALTKTQVACTLDALLSEGHVEKKQSSGRYVYGLTK